MSEWPRMVRSTGQRRPVDRHDEAIERICAWLDAWRQEDDCPVRLKVARAWPPELGFAG